MFEAAIPSVIYPGVSLRSRGDLTRGSKAHVMPAFNTSNFPWRAGGGGVLKAAYY